MSNTATTHERAHTVVVARDVVVCGGGVRVEVGVDVDFWVTVTGIVTAYELVLTEVDLTPYLVVHIFAVEYSYAPEGKRCKERAARTSGRDNMLNATKVWDCGTKEEKGESNP